MKLVKIFAALVLVVIILYFLLQNNNPVDVDLVFYQKEGVAVSVVMLGALSIGMLIGYGVALMMILAGKSELRSLKSKNQQLVEELNDLRNASIDEGIYEDQNGVD